MAHILLVEDDPADAALALQALRQNDLKWKFSPLKMGRILDYLYSVVLVTGIGLILILQQKHDKVLYES